MTWYYLTEPFAWHALLAATLVAVLSGVVGPFVVSRGMAFAVHGAAELAFTGAAAGVLVADDPVAGALLGSFVVASAFGALGARQRERDSSIGVVLAAGLGLGFFLLHFSSGFESEALNILIGNITEVSVGQLVLLVAVALVVLGGLVVIYRPLSFATADPDVAEARGVPTRLVGLAFLYLLCFTVTEASQIVGTLLVLSLVITPAAAAQRFSSRVGLVVVTSVLLALVAADGGLVLNIVIFPRVPPSVFVTVIAFGSYAIARGRAMMRR